MHVDQAQSPTTSQEVRMQFEQELQEILIEIEVLERLLFQRKDRAEEIRDLLSSTGLLLNPTDHSL